MMEWIEEYKCYSARTPMFLLVVYEAHKDDWRGDVSYAAGGLRARVGLPYDDRSLRTADEAKAAIVAKVREILTKELEALG